MDLTLALPDHVAAAWPDPDTAAAYLTSVATDYARTQAAASAADQAQAIIREAVAPFDGATPPPVPTVAERVAAVTDDQTALRAQVREVGVGLAVAAGVSQKDAVAMIDAALAVTPPPLLDAYTETR